jgi:8-oxo-dGTP pyrophosphatase MutT (NUDIX family)
MGHAHVRLRPPVTAIRDAATTIVLRRGVSGPSVLMGQRGAGAAFMPSKYVFPGGAVDPGDTGVTFARPLEAATRAALQASSRIPPEALAAAALRELAEVEALQEGEEAPGVPFFDNLGETSVFRRL